MAKRKRRRKARPKAKPKRKVTAKLGRPSKYDEPMTQKGVLFSGAQLKKIERSRVGLSLHLGRDASVGDVIRPLVDKYL